MPSRLGVLLTSQTGWFHRKIPAGLFVWSNLLLKKQAAHRDERSCEFCSPGLNLSEAGQGTRRNDSARLSSARGIQPDQSLPVEPSHWPFVVQPAVSADL